jgi:two-component system, NarL family, response regulator DevR
VEKYILLVDDNAQFREDFARALERVLAAESLDVVFVEAGSLAEARARLREGGLDAALIDVRLPDGDGLDLVREINDGAAVRIPTLVLTAYLDPTVAARAMDAGAQGAHSKAVTVPETAEAINRLTSAGRSGDEPTLAVGPIMRLGPRRALPRPAPPGAGSRFPEQPRGRRRRERRPPSSAMA